MSEKNISTPSFISTYAIILLELQSRATSSLTKYITQHSSQNKKNVSPNHISSAMMLSTQQIQEARLHPNSVIPLATAAFAAMQIALNTANNKTTILIQQQDVLKNTLSALLSAPDQNPDGTPTKAKNGIDKIRPLLTEQLKPSLEKLELLQNSLQQILPEINDSVQKTGEIWSQHYEEYFNKLASQLITEHNISLNDIEKLELRTTIASAFNAQKKIEKLEKLGIKIPKKSSDFTVAIYDAIASALGRSLQKVTDESVTSIVKKLSSLIKDENKHANALKDAHETKFKEIINTIMGYKKTAKEVIGITDDQIALVNQFLDTAVKQQDQTMNKSVIQKNPSNNKE